MCFLWLAEGGQSKSTHGEPVSREGDKPARAPMTQYLTIK